MGFFRIASFCLAQPNYVPLSVFPQSTPEPTQFELKFMAETEKKKQAYLATRFPEACIFTDVMLGQNIKWGGCRCSRGWLAKKF